MTRINVKVDGVSYSDDVEPRTLLVHYLRDVLPRNAAVLSFTHSGAVRYYTGRQIVRLDLLDAGALGGDGRGDHGLHEP